MAKCVQWKWPVTHGETVHVVMLGGLYTEKWPRGTHWETCWTDPALAEAEVASSGKAESFLKVAHLTRTRHSHQVTLMILHNLQQEALLLSKSPKDKNYAVAWRSDMQKKRPTFIFWDLITKYENLILIFITAHTEKNVHLCGGADTSLEMDAFSYQRHEVFA